MAIPAGTKARGPSCGNWREEWPRRAKAASGSSTVSYTSRRFRAPRGKPALQHERGAVASNVSRHRELPPGSIAIVQIGMRIDSHPRVVLRVTRAALSLGSKIGKGQP